MSRRRLIWIVAGIAVVGAAILLGFALGRAGSGRPTSVNVQAAVPAAAVATTNNPAPVSTPAPEQPATAVAAGGIPASSASAAKGVRLAPPITPVKPKPSGPTLKDHIGSAGAVTFLAAKNFGPPQTYAAVIVPLGWKDKSSGMLVARVNSASLSGEINASTGQPMAPAAAGTTGLSKQMSGISVLAATNVAVRSSITNKQSYKVYVVLLPSGKGAVFMVDRLR